MVRAESSNRWAGPLAVIALTALLAVTVPADAVRVDPSSDALPEPLYGYGIAEVNGQAYLVGGSDADRRFSSEIRALHPDGSTSVVANLPEALLEPAVAASGDSVYVFGGATEPANGGLPVTTDRIYRFDTGSGDVERLLGTTLPNAVSSATALRVGGYIYVLGGLEVASGTDGDGAIDWEDTVARFDPSAESIETLSVRLPTGRGQMAGVALDESAILVGGMAENGTREPCPGNQTTCQSDAILRLRPTGSGGSIDRIGTMPERVRWAAAAVYEGIVYVMGGCQGNCGAHRGTDAIVAVDASNGDAAGLPVTMPVKGGRNLAFQDGRTAIVAGGVQANETRTNAHARIMRIELGPTAPWAPGNLTARAAEGGGVHLSWDAPAYDGGALIQGYQVLRATGAEAFEVIERHDGTTFVDRHVQLGSTYRYKVRAVNVEDAGTGSNVAVFRPSATPGTPALAARGGDGKIVVQWSAPDDSGGSPVSGYQLVGYPAAEDPQIGDCAQVTCREFSPSVGYFEVDALDGGPVQNGESYTFHVRARNENGYGPFSDAAEATANPVPDPPTALEATKGLVDGQATVNLTWRDTPDEHDAYVVHRGRSLATLESVGETDAARFSDEGVPTGQQLYYAVSATSKAREGPLSHSVRIVFPTPPGEVRNLTARWTGSDVIVGWRVPADLGGGALSTYELAVTRGATDPADAGATPVEVEASPYTDSKPPRGGPATYHVRAVTEGGAGPWTMAQVRVPATQDTGPPDAVLSVVPSNADPGEGITFDASGSVDDEGIVAYSFDFGDGDATGWQTSPRARHAYTEKGVYTATLVVRDQAGLESDPAEATIAIGPPPEEDGPGDGGDADPTDGQAPRGTPLGALVAMAGLAGAAMVARRRS